MAAAASTLRFLLLLCRLQLPWPGYSAPLGNPRSVRGSSPAIAESLENVSEPPGERRPQKIRECFKIVKKQITGEFKIPINEKK
jgi:hypothetical protein